MSDVYRKTFEVHRVPRNGETTSDVSSEMVLSVHPKISVESISVRRFSTSDVATVVLEGFGNALEVEDHISRFESTGGSVRVLR